MWRIVQKILRNRAKIIVWIATKNFNFQYLIKSKKEVNYRALIRAGDGIITQPALHPGCIGGWWTKDSGVWWRHWCRLQPGNVRFLKGRVLWTITLWIYSLTSLKRSYQRNSMIKVNKHGTFFRAAANHSELQ